MIYFLLKNKKGYLKQIQKGEFQVVDGIGSYLKAYKFACEKSALVFKEANKLDDFDVIEVRCL